LPLTGQGCRQRIIKISSHRRDPRRPSARWSFARVTLEAVRAKQPGFRSSPPSFGHSDVVWGEENSPLVRAASPSSVVFTPNGDVCGRAGVWIPR